LGIRAYIAGLAAICCLTAPASAQEPVQQASAATDYLRPGDVVQLRIWREPDMSGQYIVDEAGTVVFPRVGEYRVLDDTPETLGARVFELEKAARPEALGMLLAGEIELEGRRTRRRAPAER